MASSGRESRALEQTHGESVAATAWGTDAVDAAERSRERAPPGTLRHGRGRRGLGPRPARGGWARPAGPRRRLARLESAPEPWSSQRRSPKLTGTPSTRSGESGRGRRGRAREQTADAGPRDHNATTPKTKKHNTGPRHPRPPKTTKAHGDVLRVLPGDVGRIALHGRRGAGLGHSGGELDRAVRPAGMIAASRLQRGAVAATACSRDHAAVNAT